MEKYFQKQHRLAPQQNAALLVLLYYAKKLFIVLVIVVEYLHPAQKLQAEATHRENELFIENAHYKQHDEQHLHYRADDYKDERTCVKPEQHIGVDDKAHGADEYDGHRVHHEV